MARVLYIALAALAASGAGCARARPLSEEARVASTEKAIFAAGCFWGVQSAFDKVKGVVSTAVGYTGGHTKRPTYSDVCSDTTGHAEAIFVEFDPTEVSYRQLVEHFFGIHDPTTPNRQGPDTGSQYRSAIFYITPEQKAEAEAVRDRLDKSGQFGRPIVTEIAPASAVWKAEEYHQKYHEKHGGACPTG
jgi:methionine-S-sulfoxide reductase